MPRLKPTSRPCGPWSTQPAWCSIPISAVRCWPSRRLTRWRRRARSAVNLEYDLEGGGRGERDTLVEEALCALTGAEAATVVNNNAAAVLLALDALAARTRSRGLPRRAASKSAAASDCPTHGHSGARLREVGTTNRTHSPTNERAIGPEYRRSCSRSIPQTTASVGFTAEVGLAELVESGGAVESTWSRIWARAR